MATEIEVKLAVEDLSIPRARLIERGATRIGSFFETNVFLDSEDRSLLSKDSGLRLRTSRNLETGQSEFVVTFKGPRLPGQFKSREELEVSVSDPATAIVLFERLGFNVLLSFEKKRERFSFMDCHIELDELPHLGTYLEIEGPDENTIDLAQAALDLSHYRIEKSGYASMVMGYLQKQGDARTLTF